MTQSENSTGNVQYDLPRAVKVRNPDNLKDIHSAVYSGVSILVNTRSEAEAIIAGWDEIALAISSKVMELLPQAKPVE